MTLPRKMLDKKALKNNISIDSIKELFGFAQS